MTNRSVHNADLERVNFIFTLVYSAQSIITYYEMISTNHMSNYFLPEYSQICILFLLVSLSFFLSFEVHLLYSH